MVRYGRVLVKLSGGAFSGAEDFGFDKTAVDLLADEILEVTRLGVQVAIMVGGGNVFRGRLAEPYIRLRAIKHLEKCFVVIFAAGTGQPYVTTDYPAVQRALEIRAEVLL